MTPAGTRKYLIDDGWGNPKPTGYFYFVAFFVFFLCIGKDQTCFGFGYLGHAISISTSTSSFGSHIGQVVFICTEEQVVRPDAAPIVALVADVHSCWDWTVMQLVGKPVSPDVFSWRIIDESVPESVTASDPFPAAVGFSCLIPEPICRFSCDGCVCTSGAALGFSFDKCTAKNGLFCSAIAFAKPSLVRELIMEPYHGPFPIAITGFYSSNHDTSPLGYRHSTIIES